MTQSRLLEPFFALVRAVLAQERVNFFAPFRATVVKQNADHSLDITPDDPRMPSMSGVPLRHGLPGVTLTIDPGSAVILGFSAGDPARPFCALWEGSEATVTSIRLDASQIILGGADGAEPAAKGTTLQTYLNALAAALATHVHSGVTTGAGVSGPSPALAVPALATPPNLQASNVQVK